MEGMHRQEIAQLADANAGEHQQPQAYASEPIGRTALPMQS